MPKRPAMLRPVVLALTCSFAVVAIPSAVSAHSSDVAAADKSAASSLTISCPVPIGSEFIDSWGDARSGGRRHQGVDMIAPRGTPVATADAGFAEFKSSNLGGNAVWLTTERGDKFYYAHLDAFEGSSRDVHPGEVIGYVGSTGNARGDHLHFEAHPGGTPTNPFVSVSAACDDTEDRSGSTPSPAWPFGLLLRV